MKLYVKKAIYWQYNKKKPLSKPNFQIRAYKMNNKWFVFLCLVGYCCACKERENTQKQAFISQELDNIYAICQQKIQHLAKFIPQQATPEKLASAIHAIEKLEKFRSVFLANLERAYEKKDTFLYDTALRDYIDSIQNSSYDYPDTYYLINEYSPFGELGNLQNNLPRNDVEHFKQAFASIQNKAYFDTNSYKMLKNASAAIHISKLQILRAASAADGLKTYDSPKVLNFTKKPSVRIGEYPIFYFFPTIIAHKWIIKEIFIAEQPTSKTSFKKSYVHILKVPNRKKGVHFLNIKAILQHESTQKTDTLTQQIMYDVK